MRRSDKDGDLLTALRRALRNGQSDNVRAVFQSLEPNRQLSLAEMEVGTLSQANEATYDLSTKMLTLFAPLLHGRIRAEVRNRLLALKERTPYKEILRCLISILWEMELSSSGGSFGSESSQQRSEVSYVRQPPIHVPLQWV